MYKLGITGGIGSGKTTAINFFKKENIVIFNADEEAKQHLMHSIYLQKKLINVWGNKILTNHQIDFSKLADIVFENSQNQKIINNFIWPEVYHLIQESYIKAKNNKSTIFIVEAALLFEANFHSFFDSVLLITANKSKRINRLLANRKFTKSEIEKRIKLQMSESEKKNLASYTIENNGSISVLINKLKIFYSTLQL